MSSASHSFRIEGVPDAIRSQIDEIEDIQRRLGEGGADHTAELNRVVALCHDIRNKLQVLKLEHSLRSDYVRPAEPSLPEAIP